MSNKHIVNFEMTNFLGIWLNNNISYNDDEKEEKMDNLKLDSTSSKISFASSHVF